VPIRPFLDRDEFEIVRRARQLLPDGKTGNRREERLIVNVGIVLVFAAFHLRFLKSP
jgi:hypothetical protein